MSIKKEAYRILKDNKAINNPVGQMDLIKQVDKITKDKKEKAKAEYFDSIGTDEYSYYND